MPAVDRELKAVAYIRGASGLYPLPPIKAKITVVTVKYLVAYIGARLFVIFYNL